jgi:DNA-binding transcriptional ArsR family regulator
VYGSDADSSRESLRAVAHPIRLQILARLNRRELSAAELARELGTSQSLASYHLGRLDAAGLVELASVTPNRGALERRYRAVEPSTPRSFTVGQPEVATLISAIASTLLSRASEFIALPSSFFADAELWLNEDVAKEGHAALEKVISDFIERSVDAGTLGARRYSVTAILLRLAEDRNEMSHKEKQ